MARKLKRLHSKRLPHVNRLAETFAVQKYFRQKAKKDDRKPHKKWSRHKKIFFTLLTTFFLLIVIAILYGYILLGKTTSVFEGSPTDILNPVELQRDANGLSNILMFGTSEDDEGHSGADLADSIIVVSLNQDIKRAYMLSVPRDLWVDYGMPCSVGYNGKINAGYYCGLGEYANNQKAASAQFSKIVGGVLDLDIQYYIAVNYAVVRDVTDALGGLDVDIYTDDPRGLYDVRMDLKLSAGVNHLSGDQALALARSRNAKGGYGLSRSNFDREKNQQRILKAMQKQAANMGVLADSPKAMSVIDALGNNIRTNITMSEFRTVLDVVSGMVDEIKSIDISNLVKTSKIGSASVVIPRTTGEMDYSAIQEYIKKSLVVTSESGQVK
jgi:LCP family protein required for cell wall assembly